MQGSIIRGAVGALRRVIYSQRRSESMYTFPTRLVLIEGVMKVTLLVFLTHIGSGILLYCRDSRDFQLSGNRMNMYLPRVDRRNIYSFDQHEASIHME